MNKCVVNILNSNGRIIDAWEQLFEDEESARQYACAWLEEHYTVGSGYCFAVSGVDISFECVI